MVTAACRKVKVGRRTVYDRRQRDEDFALAWADIEERTTEQMEREAIRRGMEGFEKPVYQGKELVGHVREFSDTLLIFMLKSRRPEVYRERHTIDHAGTVRHEHSFDLSKLSPEELADLERLTRTATSA